MFTIRTTICETTWGSGNCRESRTPTETSTTPQMTRSTRQRHSFLPHGNCHSHARRYRDPIPLFTAPALITGQLILHSQLIFTRPTTPNPLLIITCPITPYPLLTIRLMPTSLFTNLLIFTRPTIPKPTPFFTAPALITRPTTP